MQCSKVHYNRVQYSTVQYNRVQYSTVQYSRAEYSRVQSNAMYCSAVLPLVLASCVRGGRSTGQHHFYKLVEIYPSILICISTGKHCTELLLCTPLSQVNHGLSQFFFTDATIVIAVKHSEGSLYIVHLITTILQNLLSNIKEVCPIHDTV